MLSAIKCQTQHWRLQTQHDTVKHNKQKMGWLLNIMIATARCFLPQSSSSLPGFHVHFPVQKNIFWQFKLWFLVEKWTFFLTPQRKFNANLKITLISEIWTTIKDYQLKLGHMLTAITIFPFFRMHFSPLNLMLFIS